MVMKAVRAASPSADETRCANVCGPTAENVPEPPERLAAALGMREEGRSRTYILAAWGTVAITLYSGIAYVQKAIVAVKGWHSGVFTPTMMKSSPEIFRFLEENVLKHGQIVTEIFIPAPAAGTP